MSDHSKILIVGPPGAGKTALLKQYDEGTFDEEVTFDKEFVTVTVDAPGGAKVDIDIYHKPQEDVSNVVGCVFVFDVNSQESFDALAPFVEKFRPHLKSSVLCCNKVEDDNRDDRVVTFAGCKETYAGDLPAFETSGKSGKGVKPVFSNLMMLCASDVGGPPPAAAGDGAGAGAGGKKRRGCVIS